MRWIATEVFVAGEANPFPDATPAVRRRVRAFPLDQRPWLVLVDFFGVRTLQRLYDRRAHSVVGEVWVRRSMLRLRLRLRRAMCTVWLVLALAAVVDVAARGNRDEQVVRAFSVEIVVLLVAAILLFLGRLRAVIDPAVDAVGVRGS